MPPNVSVAGGVASRDVGVAIALRRARRRQQREQDGCYAPLSPTFPTEEQQQATAEATTKTMRRRIPPTRCWWHDLGIGLSLYLSCIYLPTLYRIVAYLYHSVWCPLAKSFIKQLVGGDAAWTDVCIILLLSTSLAIVRIAVVQWLIDTQSPHHLEAMVRCKSIHLLSSAYPQSLTPTATPMTIRVVGNLDSAPSLPSLCPVVATAAVGEEDQTTTATLQPSRITHATEGNEERTSLQPRVNVIQKISLTLPPIQKSPSWVERYVIFIVPLFCVYLPLNVYMFVCVCVRCVEAWLHPSNLYHGSVLTF